VAVRIAVDALVRALDERVGDSISRHLDLAALSGLRALPRDVALAGLIDAINEAIAADRDEVSKQAREPYNGVATIDGELVRLRLGPVPRSAPDRGWLAPELQPIPIALVLTGDSS
jgi:hypothetical protein